MRGRRLNSGSASLARTAWWRWLCVALVATLSLGPGGLERVHIGATHDHLEPASRGRGTVAGPAVQSSHGTDTEVSAPCDTCRELEWARLNQTGTCPAVLCYAPTGDVVDRFIPINEQVRAVESAAHIRSRAPPTT